MCGYVWVFCDYYKYMCHTFETTNSKQQIQCGKKKKLFQRLINQTTNDERYKQNSDNNTEWIKN